MGNDDGTEKDILESEKYMWGVSLVHTPHIPPFFYWQLLCSVESTIEKDSENKR